jgi:hypothetical protein
MNYKQTTILEVQIIYNSHYLVDANLPAVSASGL